MGSGTFAFKNIDGSFTCTVSSRFTFQGVAVTFGGTAGSMRAPGAAVSRTGGDCGGPTGDVYQGGSLDITLSRTGDAFSGSRRQDKVITNCGACPMIVEESVSGRVENNSISGTYTYRSTIPRNGVTTYGDSVWSATFNLPSVCTP
jgi:hypothetical protein